MDPRPLNFSSTYTAREARDWFAETLAELDKFGDATDAELAAAVED